jgi:pyruvate dehydrogenase E1 component alpha subunit
VLAAAGEAIGNVRSGAGPYLLECMTYRMAGHFVGDPQHYRSKEEIAAWHAKDPIERLKRHIQQSGIAASELDSAGESARQEVQRAADRARGAPRPNPADVLADVYSAKCLNATAG